MARAEQQEKRQTYFPSFSLFDCGIQGSKEVITYMRKREKWRNSLFRKWSHFLGEGVGFRMTTDSAPLDYFLYSTSTLNEPYDCLNAVRDWSFPA